MAKDFPNSPSLNDTVIISGIKYTFNGVSWIGEPSKDVIDVSGANAIESDVLENKTFYAGNTTKKTGTIAQKTVGLKKIKTLNETITVETGFHKGGYVSIDDEEKVKLIPENIKNGINILGVSGTANNDTIGKYLVRWIDYDGTILKSEYVVSGNNATAPTTPDHSALGLTFVEWTHSGLSIEYHTDIGAIFKPTNTRTKIRLRIDPIEETLTMDFWVFNYYNEEINIDYGDGVTESVTQSGGIKFTHTFQKYNTWYEIEIWKTGDLANYCLGEAGWPFANYDAGNEAVSPNPQGYFSTSNSSATEVEIFLSDKIDKITKRALNIVALTVLVAPNIRFGDWEGISSQKLKTFIVNENFDDLSEITTDWFLSAPIETLCLHENLFSAIQTIWFGFLRGTKLKRLNLKGAYYISSAAFRHNYYLEEVYMPDVINVNGGAFRYCYALKNIIANSTFNVGLASFEDCALEGTLDIINDRFINPTDYLIFKNCKFDTLDLTGYTLTDIKEGVYDCPFKSITWSSNITTLRTGAFKLLRMDLLVIPSHIETLEQGCINSANVKKIHLDDNQMKSAPTGYPFSTSIRVYVASNLVDDYKTTSPWSDHPENFFSEADL